MVELNFDRQRPDHLLDLGRVRELAEWVAIDGQIRLGAGVTYTRVIDELGGQLPGLLDHREQPDVVASENHAPMVSTWWAPSVSAQPVPGSPSETASITRQNVGRPNA